MPTPSPEPAAFDLAAPRPGTGLVAGQAPAGVTLRRLEPHEDLRGRFTEVFAEHWGLGAEAVQWSVVDSGARVLRGMHLHRRHAEYLVVLRGVALVGLVDLRPGSPPSGAWSLYRLDAAEPALLAWPARVLHGWYSVEPTLHLQGVSEAYRDYAEDDNLRVRWDDPGLGIPWPDPAPVLSPRAAAAGGLDALRARLAREGCPPAP